MKIYFLCIGLMLTLVIQACGGQSSGLSVSLKPATVSLEQGKSATLEVTVKSTEDLAGVFTVSLEDPPAGVTVPPVTVTLNQGSGKADLMMDATADAKIGNHSVKVKAKNASKEEKTNLNLTIVGVCTIADSALEDAIKRQLRKPSISCADMEGLIELDASTTNITNLAGLNKAVNLKTLYLYNNSDLSDISSLSALTALETLNLSGTKVADIKSLTGLNKLTNLNLSYHPLDDISPLSGLTNLSLLFLSITGVTDISDLSKLTKLTILNLDSNQISDISVLANMKALVDLSLRGNQIEDITALSGLTTLKDLHLGSNQIRSLSSLVTNTGLSTGDTIYLDTNCLDLSAGSTEAEHINQLSSRGVTVFADEQQSCP
jgi:hypothetical protein